MAWKGLQNALLHQPAPPLASYQIRSCSASANSTVDEDWLSSVVLIACAVELLANHRQRLHNIRVVGIERERFSQLVTALSQVAALA